MRSFSILVLILSCLVASAEDKEIIKNKSPDGRFALRLAKTDEGWEAAIIDTRTKVAAVDLETYQKGYVEGARLLWSKDSKRVAYFEPDRRGGSTTLYFRNGDKFENVELPQIPECKTAAKEVGKTIDATTKPQKWLGSDTLVVAIKETWISEGGNTHNCSQTVTIAFDAQHKPSVQSVTDKKRD